MKVKTVYPGGGQRFSVRSVTKMEIGSDGSVTRIKLGGRKRKRKVSKPFRRWDKMMRRMSKAQETAARDYLLRHNRSNNKKKNGAVKDLTKNFRKSQRKGIKKLKIW